MRERAATLTLAAALAVLTGCAGMLPVTSAPPTPAPVPATAPAPGTPAPSPAVATRTAIDTTAVSPAGSAVLGSIVEPLPQAERVPAPTPAELRAAAPGAPATPGPGGVTEVAPEAAYDTLRFTRPAADSASTDVPVPSPTQPLGDKPGTLARLLAPDTSASAAPAPPAASAPAPPVAAPPTRTPAPAKLAPGTPCWRVQVGAPAERAKADGLRAAAESQLLVAFVVEREKGLFKVRTRDCVSGEAADALKRRATLAGFGGVFRFAGTAR